MDHVVNFSSGKGSAIAAKRVAEQHGTENLTLLFADTKIEDEDNYRFLHEAAAWVGGRLVIIQDGRTPWEVFKAVRFLGNSQHDPCSDRLKRKLLWGWIEEHCKPEETIVYFGIDWSEEHRLERTRKRRPGWRCEAPLCEPPYLERDDMLAILSEAGIKPPRLYGMGFHHANCGGFCIKSGQAQFAQLLKTMPERYAMHEQAEEDFRAFLGKDVSIMKDRSGKQSKPLTMRAFRKRLECNEQYDLFEWGGCGCALD